MFKDWKTYPQKLANQQCSYIAICQLNLSSLEDGEMYVFLIKASQM